jgi:hypothetical protein
MSDPRFPNVPPFTDPEFLAMLDQESDELVEHLLQVTDSIDVQSSSYRADIGKLTLYLSESANEKYKAKREAERD